MKIKLTMPVLTKDAINFETETVELLECPFCKGESELLIRKHCGGRKGSEYEYTPRCKKTSCAGRLTKKWLNIIDAINAWNGHRAKKIEYKGYVKGEVI